MNFLSFISRRNSVLLSLILLVVFVEVLVFMPKDLDIAPPAQISTARPASPGANGQVMKNLHLVEAKSSGKEWELWAEQAVKPRDGFDWNIEKVKVRFFGVSGVQYLVTGDRGVVSTQTNDITISGNVETRSSNGYLLKSKQVNYLSKERNLVSKSPVEMSGKNDLGKQNLHVTGNDLLAELSTNRIFINENVKTRRLIKDDKFATIHSSKAVFSGQDRTAEFQGRVVAEYNSMQMTGPAARFRYLPDGSELESMVALGGVKLTDVNRMATSQQINVNFLQDSVVLNGKPRVLQNEDELVGEQIVISEGGKKVRVNNIKARLDSERLETRKE